MIDWQMRSRLGTLLVLVTVVLHGASPVWGQETDTLIEGEVAENTGLAELDEALRLKVTSNGLRDLNQVIKHLETAIDQGLDEQDNDFAEQMLSDSLMERATTLMRVINARSIADERVQKIRNLVTSDLRDVLAYGDPPAAAYLMLGKLQVIPGGDPRESRRAINNYLKFDDQPDDQRAEALALRARMVKDQSKAIADLNEASRLAPENMSYLLTKALFLRRDNKLDEALGVIDEVRQLAPEDAKANANAVILQGEIYRQQSRFKEALASFDKATELAPQSPAPFQNRGEIYRLQGKFEQAISQFNEVLKLQPGVLMTLLNRADAFMASGKLAEALADTEVVLEKQPLVETHPVRIAAHRLRAEILTRLNRVDEAIVEMESVSAAIPNQPELKLQLALYYLANQQPSKAIDAYNDVLEQHPDNFKVLQLRGDAYLNVGKHAEAIADFNRALNLKPDDTTLLNNLAWVLATSPEDDLRDGKRAVELASKACAMTEYKTPHILSTLAAAFAEDGNFETAIKWSQQAVDLNDPVHAEQLVKELNSYRDGQPWREKHSIDEKSESLPLVDTPQAPPNEVQRFPSGNPPNGELQLPDSDAPIIID